MSFFSGKAEMVILYANFMIEVSHQAAAGHSQLVAAKDLKPGIVQQVDRVCSVQGYRVRLGWVRLR